VDSLPIRDGSRRKHPSDQKTCPDRRATKKVLNSAFILFKTLIQSKPNITLLMDTRLRQAQYFDDMQISRRPPAAHGSGLADATASGKVAPWNRSPCVAHAIDQETLVSRSSPRGYSSAAGPQRAPAPIQIAHTRSSGEIDEITALIPGFTSLDPT
jgi:hypothetical protein